VILMFRHFLLALAVACVVVVSLHPCGVCSLFPFFCGRGASSSFFVCFGRLSFSRLFLLVAASLRGACPLRALFRLFAGCFLPAVVVSSSLFYCCSMCSLRGSALSLRVSVGAPLSLLVLSLWVALFVRRSSLLRLSVELGLSLLLGSGLSCSPGSCGSCLVCLFVLRSLLLAFLFSRFVVPCSLRALVVTPSVSLFLVSSSLPSSCLLNSLLFCSLCLLCPFCTAARLSPCQ